MKLFQFFESGKKPQPPYHRVKCSIGAVLDGNSSKFVDLTKTCGLDNEGITDMVSLLAKGPQYLNKLSKQVTASAQLRDFAECCYLPPITSPDKILCIGMNCKNLK